MRPSDVIAAAFRVAPGEERTGDKTPGDIAQVVLHALAEAGWTLRHMEPHEAGPNALTAQERADLDACDEDD